MSASSTGSKKKVMRYEDWMSDGQSAGGGKDSENEDYSRVFDKS
jgi:hypothetical protein